MNSITARSIAALRSVLSRVQREHDAATDEAIRATLASDIAAIGQQLEALAA